jgi:hypothetical protein
MKTTHAIIQVPYWGIEAVWPEAAPMLQRALDTQDEWTLEAVRRELLSAAYNQRPMQLWMIPGRFALVTQIQVFPSGVRKCLLFLGGGADLEAIKAAQPVVAAWAARFHGCTKLLIYGRRGFLRALDGFKEISTVMERDIWDGAE